VPEAEKLYVIFLKFLIKIKLGVKNLNILKKAIFKFLKI
jgi:hypothetical protein